MTGQGQFNKTQLYVGLFPIQVEASEGFLAEFSYILQNLLWMGFCICVVSAVINSEENNPNKKGC